MALACMQDAAMSTITTDPHGVRLTLSCVYAGCIEVVCTCCCGGLGPYPHMCLCIGPLGPHAGSGCRLVYLEVDPGLGLGAHKQCLKDCVIGAVNVYRFLTHCFGSAVLLEPAVQWSSGLMTDDLLFEWLF